MSNNFSMPSPSNAGSSSLGITNWNHAGKIFVDNGFALAPKPTYLYHVFFEFNNSATISDEVSSNTKTKELGMMVKQISLPKFSIDTKSHNAYNRSHVVQTKIHYDPVSIVFHDDSSNVVQSFWSDYYNYYYRDGDTFNSKSIDSAESFHNEITSARTQSDWGYTIRGSAATLQKGPYLRSVRIYSLFNKKFTEYTLVNPLIKSFQHGEHNSADTSTMQHSMIIEYEAIRYATGGVSTDSVSGFGDLHYDQTPSPLQSNDPDSGPATNVRGIEDLVKQDGFIPDAFANLKNSSNPYQMSGVETNALSRSIRSGSNNPFGTVNIPAIGSLQTNNIMQGRYSLSSIPGFSSIPGMAGIPGMATISAGVNFRNGKVSAGVSTGLRVGNTTVGSNLGVDSNGRLTTNVSSSTRIGNSVIGSRVNVNSRGQVTAGIVGSTRVGGSLVGGNVGINSRGQVSGSVRGSTNLNGMTSSGGSSPYGNSRMYSNAGVQSVLRSQSGVPAYTSVGGVARLPSQTMINSPYSQYTPYTQNSQGSPYDSTPSAYRNSYSAQPSFPANLLSMIPISLPNLVSPGVADDYV